MWEFIQKYWQRIPEPDQAKIIIGIIVTVLLGGILGVLLREIIGILKRTLQSIWKLIYNTFAGLSLFNPISIRRYKKSIREKLTYLKVPFMDKPLELTKIYVPLKVFEEKGFKESGNELEVIDPFSAIKKYKKIMMLGIPGSGKSTMLKSLTRNLCENRRRNSQDSIFPILVDLGKFESEKRSLTNYLVETLNQNKLRHLEIWIRPFYQNAKKGYKIKGLRPNLKWA